MPLLRGAAKGLGMGAGMAAGQRAMDHLFGGRNNRNQHRLMPYGQQQVQCLHCGQMTDFNRRYCGSCGQEAKVQSINYPTATSAGFSCSCGAVNEQGKKFCYGCGNALVTPPAADFSLAKKCGRCGAGISGAFCSGCGAKL